MAHEQLRRGAHGEARAAVLWTWVGLSLTSLLSGCLKDDRYIGPPGGGDVFVVGLTDATPPIFQGDEDVLFLVETQMLLPIVPPTAEEMAALTSNTPAPYGRMPWVLLRDLDLSIDFVVKNLDDVAHTPSVVANGISEFHEYVPGVTVDPQDGAVTPNLSQWERAITIPPFGSVSRSIRLDEIDEIAVDLATVANGAPNPDLVIYFANHSAHDPRVQEFVPDVIAGLVGMRIGLLTTEVANLVLEVSVRVRNNEGRLADPEDPTTWWTLPQPLVLPPPVVVP